MTINKSYKENTRRMAMLSALLVVMAMLPACKQDKKQEQTAKNPPNIIFIMADDLGYGDLGCYGQKDIKTPNIDRLAEDGIRFTQAYAGSTVCAPSRSALMSGLHTGHTPVRGNFSIKNERVPIPDSVVTVAEALKQHGYATGLFGKWGLGEHDTEGTPNRQGFDTFYGFLNQARAHFYCTDYAWHNDEKVYFRGNNEDTCGVNVAEWYFGKMKDFIRDNVNRPFFAYYATQLPHAELRSTKEDMEQYVDAKGKSIFEETTFEGHGEYGPHSLPFATYAAMVSQLDRHVGDLVKLLNENGLAENTILFFTSDNGPHKEGGLDPYYFDSNGPLRGIKRDLYEGGIRVPLIVKWPGKAEAGKVSDYTWAHWDLLPTAMEIAGAQSAGNIDGVSALPVLLGENRKRPGVLYWELHENKIKGDLKAAVRNGKWKAVWNSLYGNIELYNLEEDPGETDDLAAQNPDKVQKFKDIISKERRPSAEWPVDEEQLRRSIR